MENLAFLRKIMAEVEGESSQALIETNKILSIKLPIEDFLSSVRNLPYTVHDWRHSEKVEKLCSQLIPLSFLKKLSIKEFSILIIGLWLHDGGMVPDYEGQSNDEIRTHHHRRISRRIKEKTLPFLAGIDPITCEALAILCESHCWSTIHEVPETFLIGSNVVRLKLLSAILRLCDICDVSFDRTPWYIQQNFMFSRESKKHWETHLLIDGFSARQGKTTCFVIQGRYTSEQDQEYIRKTADYIEKELENLQPIFNKYNWKISTIIDRNFWENNPEGDKPITVLPQNIYMLLFEYIYESRSVYIRELVQNAIDSCKIKGKWCESESFDYDPVIQVTLYNKIKDGEQHPYILRIFDNGIGMNQADVNDFLLEIGKGIMKSQNIQELLHSGEVPEELIAEFGIGFLTCFPIAERIVIKTQKDGFYGLRLEFPDFSQDYETISHKRVQIRKGNLPFNGTIVVLYLNELGRSISVYDALQQYCHNVRFPMCYQENIYTDVEDLWGTHMHSPSCHLVRKRFLGQDAENEFKVTFNFEKETDFEGLIAYFPLDKLNNFYVSQEGIFIEDCTDLIPEGFVGIRGEINLMPKVIGLTAPRNRIIRNEKFNVLKDRLRNYFDILLGRLVSNSPIRADNIGWDQNQVIAFLNRSYQIHKIDRKKLRSLYTQVEKHVKVFYGDADEMCSLFDIRKKLDAKNQRVVYQLIEHRYTYLFMEIGEIDGYEVKLVPILNRIKAKALTKKGKIVFTTYHISKHEKERLYKDRFLFRDFYRSYFEIYDYEVYQSEPTDVGQLISHSTNRDLLENSEIIQSLYGDKGLKCLSEDIQMRCVFKDKSNRYLNVSHPVVKRILEKYRLLKEKKQITPEQEALLNSYLHLICLNLNQSIESLETLLLETFNSMLNNTDSE